MKKIIRQLLYNFILLMFFSCFAVSETLAVAKKEASPSAAAVIQEATPAAEVTVIPEKKTDITVATPEIKDKLERYLAEYPSKPLTVTNFLQHGIRQTIKKGVPANTVVLILLFPLVAAIIAASRHIIGIRGLGIFLPAVLSVVFVATGIVEGLLLFLTIILVASGAKSLIKILKLQYLPRMALVLCFVSFGVLGLLMLAPVLNLNSLISLSIFPILILILLTDSFISFQEGMSFKEAVRMILETLGTALVCSIVLQLDFLQKFVLLNPEITVLGVVILDIFMGKYVGLRLLEYKKFKEILK